MKRLLPLVLVVIMAVGSSSLDVLADAPYGCTVRADPSRFDHPGLAQLTWTTEIREYDFVPSSSGAFGIRSELNSIGFMGKGTASPCYVAILVQNIAHDFSDNKHGRIDSFPSVGLCLTSFQPGWPDSSHGVELIADPSAPPQFGRCFGSIDGSPHTSKTVCTRQSLGTPSPSKPIRVKWTVTKGKTVTNPEGDLSQTSTGEWEKLNGTFVKWNFKADINGDSYDVAGYFLPIERAEYIRATDPLVLTQEYSGGGERAPNTLKGTVIYTEITASDDVASYDLKEWMLTARADDGAGNFDTRFGWKSDGASLISTAGHEQDSFDASRDIGRRFSLGTPAPRITGASTSGKRLFVYGTAFGDGAKILIDGEVQKKTANDEMNPTTVLIGAKAAKSIASSSMVLLTVRNSDGSLSNGFRFTRP